MTAVPPTQTRSPVTELEPDTHTLADEHALLMRDVRRRAASVLALVAGGSWPGAELQTLTGFLRTTVLRQASDEEVLLYPNAMAAPFGDLSAEHGHLHTLIEQLDQADPDSCSLPKLGGLVERLLRLLEDHLVAEEAGLAALPDGSVDVPAVADVLAGTVAWLVPDDDPVVIVLDALPKERAVQMCLERLLRLRPGESAEVHSSRDGDLQRVCEWMHRFDSARYGFERVRSGHGLPALQVTRRQTT